MEQFQEFYEADNAPPGPPPPLPDLKLRLAGTGDSSDTELEVTNRADSRSDSTILTRQVKELESEVEEVCKRLIGYSV